MIVRGLGIVAAAVFGAGCSTLGVKIDARPERVQQQEMVAVLAAKPSSSAAARLAAIPSKTSASDRLSALVEVARLAVRERNASVYNLAVARLAVLVAEQKFADLPAGLTVAGPDRTTLDPRQAESLLLASSVRIRGLLQRSEQPGWGAPFVAWLPKDAPLLAGQPGIPRPGMAIPVTAWLDFRGSRATLTFQQTLVSDHVRLDGRRVQLAADFSAPIAVLISRGRNRSIDIEALFRTNRYYADARLLQFQPYDPRKIPVVFVHGLISRPEAWTQALNGLLADPKIRDRYQFWFFLYPTGLSVWASAAVLRSELDRFRTELGGAARNPRLDEMVLVGHSMGGLISSLMIREGGEKLWDQFSRVPASRLKLSPESKDRILRLIFFLPRNDVRRVIFVATPHRGSLLAERPIVSFFSRLIRMPFAPTTADWIELRAAMRDDVRNILVAPANSLTFLRAKSPLLLSILNLPLAPEVTYHSIIGDRGRGDTPNSSDGVVPYWSSHLEGAASEKIVPSGHGANENRQGIEEIRRILSEAGNAGN